MLANHQADEIEAFDRHQHADPGIHGEGLVEAEDRQAILDPALGEGTFEELLDVGQVEGLGIPDANDPHPRLIQAPECRP